MRKLFTLLGCGGLLLTSFAGAAQCSNQVSIRYYDNGTLVNTSVTNKGQSGYNGSVCPSAGAQYSFSGSSTSDAVLTWSRVIDQRVVNDPSDDLVEDIKSAPVATSTTATPNELSASASFTTTTLFRIKSDAGKNSYPGSNCNNSTVTYVYLTLAPTLSLAAPSAALAGICSGTSITLTASGATSGGYTWAANGVTIPGETGATLTVAPTATTTYTVMATTSCGSSSQQVTVPVKGVLISPAAPTVCANQPTALTASYSGTSATYQWFEKGSATVLSNTASVSVAPAATTTYQVVATTSDCSTITRDVTVSVGTPTVNVASGNATICAGSSVSLTAVSSNPGATYAWSPTTGLNTSTGATVVASPSGTTSYTVTATSPCGATASTQVVVSVAATPTYAVTPSSATVCTGNATLLAASSGITNTTYQWYRTTDLGTILSTASTLEVAPTANTTYRVVTTTPCGSNSQDVPVTVNAKPTAAVTPASTTADSGASTTLTASGGTAYAWTATTNGTTTALSATTATITVAPTATTTYTATVTNAAGCQSTAQAQVTVRPLPVELVSFEAAWADKAARLTWATASEKNSAYFDIERSTDGKEFAAVGRRAGAGSTSTRSEYVFVDAELRSLTAPTVYYRLHQVDATGEDSYSPVRSLQVSTGMHALAANVFPNPSDGRVAVQLFTLSTAPVAFTVHNLMGQVLLTHRATPVPGSQEIALPKADALPVGVYYLTIRQGNQQQVLPLSRR